MYQLKQLTALIFFISLLSFAPNAQAETIELKSGEAVEGVILTRTNDFVEVDTGVGVSVTYYLDEIDSIGGIKVRAESVANENIPITDEDKREISNHKISSEQYVIEDNKIIPIDESQPQDKPVENKIRLSITPQRIEESVIVDDQVKQIEEQLVKLNTDFPGEIKSFKEKVIHWLKVQKRKVHKQVSHLTMIYKIFPVDYLKPLIYSWLLCSIPLFFIARRMGTSNSWTAFVPILNFFLLIQMADRNFAILLHYILPAVIVAIPFYFPVDHALFYYFTGVLWMGASILIIPILLWINILRIMNYPAWLGVLTIIPGLNVLFHIYLAIPRKRKSSIVPNRVAERVIASRPKRRL